MTAAYERRLKLTGSFNFRDLGGYETADGRQVRRRRLFRSDALHGLTPEDMTQLDEIGLTAVFDLRSAMELERDGLGPLFAGGVLHHHVPFTATVGSADARDFGSSLSELYQRMLKGAQPCISTIFSALAEEQTYPAVFHLCGRQGSHRDHQRTGVERARCARRGDHR